MWPSPVHSVKATSHRNFGFDPVHGAPFAGAHAFCLVARQDRFGGFDFAQRSASSRALFIVKPVPTLPA